jgi:hypothetical protein
MKFQIANMLKKMPTTLPTYEADGFVVANQATCIAAHSQPDNHNHGKYAKEIALFVMGNRNEVLEFLGIDDKSLETLESTRFPNYVVTQFATNAKKTIGYVNCPVDTKSVWGRYAKAVFPQFKGENNLLAVQVYTRDSAADTLAKAAAKREAAAKALQAKADKAAAKAQAKADKAADQAITDHNAEANPMKANDDKANGKVTTAAKAAKSTKKSGKSKKKAS